MKYVQSHFVFFFYLHTFITVVREKTFRVDFRYIYNFLEEMNH